MGLVNITMQCDAIMTICRADTSGTYQSPEVLQQPLYHWSVAVGKPEELADDVPILLRQPIIVHLSLVEVSERS